MISRIHVNQHVIRANKKSGSKDPVISVKRSGINTYTSSARIVDSTGKEVARVVYSPDKPLDCGATVWIETTCHVLT